MLLNIEKTRFHPTDTLQDYFGRARQQEPGIPCHLGKRASYTYGLSELLVKEFQHDKSLLCCT